MLNESIIISLGENIVKAYLTQSHINRDVIALSNTNKSAITDV